MESQREPRLIGYKKKVDPPPPHTETPLAEDCIAVTSRIYVCVYCVCAVWYVYNMHAH